MDACCKDYTGCVYGVSCGILYLVSQQLPTVLGNDQPLSFSGLATVSKMTDALWVLRSYLRRFSGKGSE